MLSQAKEGKLFNTVYLVETERQEGKSLREKGAVEGRRGQEAGSIWEQELQTEIKKGIRLLFITAYHPVINWYPSKFFDFHLMTTRV